MTTWDTSKPRTEPFPGIVTAMARAGYAVHRARKRKYQTWEQLNDHERYRWQLAAEAMAVRHLHSPEQVRDVYFTDYTDMPWDDAKPAAKKRWEDIVQAMRRTFDDWTAAQRRALERDANARRVAREDLARAERPVVPTPVPTASPVVSQPVEPTSTEAPPRTPPATPANARQIATLRERLIEKRRNERKGIPA